MAMHIVLVGDYPRRPNAVGGGVEAVMLYLTQALQQYRDLRVSVVTLARDKVVHPAVRHGAVEVHYVAASKLPSRLSVTANIHRMRAQIARLQPDLVHAHGTGEYAFAAALCGVPWVLTLHGMRHQEVALRRGLINRYRAWLVEKDERAIVARAPHVIAINPHVEHVFGDCVTNNVYSIENPIADAFFDIPDRHCPGHILYVGRLTPRKDVMTLLHAFAHLYCERPAAKLLLAGEGTVDGEPTPYYLELRRFVTESGLDRAVKFLGNLPDDALLDEYANCAAVALASKVETAPMAITQAMAAGKPVVTTNAGGARYLVKNGETGFIVPVEDSHALACALRRVLDDETEAANMGRLAKELAERRFRASVVAAQTREVYDIAISRN